jgi:hypothetical protein
MAFDITINKEDMPKFTAIVNTIFEGFAYVPLNKSKKKLTFKIGFLGEDEEKIEQLQESLMEHLGEVDIEEIIGG